MSHAIICFLLDALKEIKAHLVTLETKSQQKSKETLNFRPVGELLL
jgi:hypothetical protein